MNWKLKWSIGLAIYCIIVASAVAYVAMKKLPVTLHTPAFYANDCFMQNEVKEDWEDKSLPDGIIVRVGKKSYLTMHKLEAEKTSKVKRASTLSIDIFDELHYKVRCPDSWLKHTNEKVNPAP